MSDLAGTVEALRSLPPAAVYALVFLAGFGEYVLPVLPGDTVVVASAVLVTAFGWSLPATFAAVTASNVAGAWATYEAGRRLSQGRLDAVSPRRRAAIEAVLALVRRHGLVIIALNRFFPGIRSGFFVAAGVARLPLLPVLAWSAVGGALWNALLLGLGVAAGRNLAWFEATVQRIGLALVLGVVAVIAGVAWVVRRALRDHGAR